MKEDLKYAGFWIRVFATIVDWIIISFIIYPLHYFFYGERVLFFNEKFWENNTFVLGPTDFLLSYVFPITIVLIFWNYYQATPGKLLFSIKIVNADNGKKPTLGRFIIRYIGYIPSFAVFLLGILWVAFNSRKQGWHDKMANTVVIRKVSTSEKVQFKKK